MTARSYPEDVELADGRAIRVRPIETGDAEALREGFAHLSDEARYRRFLTPTERLTEQQVAYFVDVDHHDHEALVALRADTGEGIAVARYIREADHRDRAEFAAVVLDEWQGAGIGTLLCERLAERARAEGIRYASGLMLAGNDSMLGILRRLGPEISSELEAGTVDVMVELARDD